MAKKKNSNQAPSEVRILFNEVGSGGLKAYSGFVNEAYNSTLYWPQVEPIYNKLLSNPTVSMVWRTFQSWGKQVKPVVNLPKDATDDDKAYKEFLESDFENMDGGFGRYMDIAAYLPIMFGFAVFDTPLSRRDPAWVPPVDKGKPADDWRSEEDDGLIGIRRIALRKSFLRWDMPDQSTKKIFGMWQQDFPNPAVKIPLDKDHGLHHIIGDPTNPEGKAGLESVWRTERLQYGYQTVHAIGTEHAAGHLSVRKTEAGTLSDADKLNVADAAKNLLSAQEGNYAYWPYGIEGSIIDTNFQAASVILETIKYFDIMILSIFSMQGMVLNTLTRGGSHSAQTDTSDLAVFNFNSMIDGLARQYDDQIGKRLFRLNKDAFPNITARPRITFKHVDRNVALDALGNFIQSINGIIPLGPDDNKLIRQQADGVLAENDPDLKVQAKIARQMDAIQNPNGTPPTTVPPQGQPQNNGKPTQAVADKNQPVLPAQPVAKK